MSIGSSEDQKSSWEDIINGKISAYIHNVEYPTVVDITGNSPQDQDSKSSSVQNTNYAQDPSPQNMTSSGHTMVQNAYQISNVAIGRNSSLDDLDKKPNFSKLHAEYKVEWYKNHPPNETRPMRLMEFIWTHCDGKSNQYNVDYLSDDTRDKDLKVIEKNCTKSIRETLMERDEKYIAEVGIRDSKYKYLDESFDDNSFKSALSNQSLVDFFSPTNECKKKVMMMILFILLLLFL